LKIFLFARAGIIGIIAAGSILQHDEVPPAVMARYGVKSGHPGHSSLTTEYMP
jgi:hypothetical protein